MLDPDKIIKFVAEFVTEWLRMTVTTIRRPVALYQLVETIAEPAPVSIVGAPAVATRWLEPRLLAHCAVSIIVGVGLTTLLQRDPIKDGFRTSAPPLFIAVIVVLFAWVAYASILHWVCRLVGGKGEYVATIGIVLQVMSTIYFLSGFVAVILASIITPVELTTAQDPWGHLHGRFSHHPVWFAFLASAALQSVYLPLAFMHAHRLTWRRVLVVLPVAFLYLAVSVAVYKVYDLRLANDPRTPKGSIASNDQAVPALTFHPWS